MSGDIITVPKQETPEKTKPKVTVGDIQNAVRQAVQESAKDLVQAALDKIPVNDIQNAVQHVIKEAVKDAINTEVEKSTIELKYELQRVKDIALEQQNILEEQKNIIVEHYRLIDERLRILNQPKPSFWDKLFSKNSTRKG